MFSASVLAGIGRELHARERGLGQRKHLEAERIGELALRVVGQQTFRLRLELLHDALGALDGDVADLLKPALCAGLLASVNSGNWTRMNLRLPPSALFNSVTACAVVPLPPKKSRMMSSLLKTNLKNSRSNTLGFGFVKIFCSPKMSVTSFDPVRLSKAMTLESLPT